MGLIFTANTHTHTRLETRTTGDHRPVQGGQKPVTGTGTGKPPSTDTPQTRTPEVGSNGLAPRPVEAPHTSSEGNPERGEQEEGTEASPHRHTHTEPHRPWSL